MISENLPFSKTEKDILDKDKTETSIPNIKYKTNSFNLFKNKFNQNIDDTNNQMQSSYKEKNYYQNRTLSTENNESKDHPLLYYALAKVSDSMKNKNIKDFPVYAYHGGDNTPNNLLKRNLFSINTRYFDDLKKKKEYTEIKNKFKEKEKENENDNYQRIKVYTSYNRKYIPEYCNKEIYNLAKKKLYARDISSNIKKGFNISMKEFNEQKNQLLKQASKSIEIKENKNDKNLKYSLDNNNNNNIEMNEKFYKTINTEVNNDRYFFKDPTDYTKEELKDKKYRFDRNNKIFFKFRNWWKIDK